MAEKKEYIERNLFCDNFCRCNAAKCAETGFKKCPIFICPTADVVEVVRCKGCRFYLPQPDKTGVCGIHDYCTDPNDFCSFGEKAEEREWKKN